MRRSSSLALKVASGSFAIAVALTGLSYAAGAKLSVTEDTPTTDTEIAATETADLEVSEVHGKSVADAVHAVIEAATERGCEFGQAVAAAASVNRQGEGGSDVDPCTRSDATTTEAHVTVEAVETEEAEETEEERTTGQAKASEASGDRSDAGRAKAEEKSNRP